MRITLLISSLCLSIFTGCTLNTSAPVSQKSKNLDKLEKSLNNWQQIKISKGSSYRYTTNFSSWIGFGSQTDIEVKDNQVIQRSYRAWDKNYKQTDSWKEKNATTLGSHKNGALAKTIDELYSSCQDILRTKEEKSYHIHLNFDNNNILKNCFYAHKQCADDCSKGVEINTLEFIKP